MNKSGADAAACEFSNNAEIPSAGMDTFMRTCDQTAHYVCAAVKYGYRHCVRKQKGSRIFRLP